MSWSRKADVFVLCLHVIQVWLGEANGNERRETHPPRKAPTGLLTGATSGLSCLSAALVWNPRLVLLSARNAGRRTRDAIVCRDRSRSINRKVLSM